MHNTTCDCALMSGITLNDDFSVKESTLQSGENTAIYNATEYIQEENGPVSQELLNLLAADNLLNPFDLEGVDKACYSTLYECRHSNSVFSRIGHCIAVSGACTAGMFVSGTNAIHGFKKSGDVVATFFENQKNS